MTKEQAIEFLYDRLDYIYCNNCRSNQSGEGCDDCIRKSMGWQISRSFAEGLATEILKEE